MFIPVKANWELATFVSGTKERSTATGFRLELAPPPAPVAGFETVEPPGPDGAADA